MILTLFSRVPGLARAHTGKIYRCQNQIIQGIMQNGVWITLFFAGILEAGWAIGLKYTEGFTRVWPSVATLVLMGGSIYLLSRSLTGLPLGTAYAVWTGIGAVGTVIAGLVLFGESRSALRLLCILLIVAGIVGLKLCSDA